jgi:hypothetical protein
VTGGLARHGSGALAINRRSPPCACTRAPSKIEISLSLPGADRHVIRGVDDPSAPVDHDAAQASRPTGPGSVGDTVEDELTAWLTEDFLVCTAEVS